MQVKKLQICAPKPKQYALRRLGTSQVPSCTRQAHQQSFSKPAKYLQKGKTTSRKNPATTTRTTHREDWCEEAVEDGPGSCECLGATSRWQLGHRKVEVEAADGSSSRQELVGVVISLHGDKYFGGRRGIIHQGRVEEQMKMSSRRRGGSRFLKYRRRNKSEDLQEQSCARLVLLASSGHSGRPCCLRAGGGGYESGLPAGREEDPSETHQDGPLEEMGSKARM